MAVIDGVGLILELIEDVGVFDGVVLGVLLGLFEGEGVLLILAEGEGVLVGLRLGEGV